jgi:hypothetical protein
VVGSLRRFFSHLAFSEINPLQKPSSFHAEEGMHGAVVLREVFPHLLVGLLFGLELFLVQGLEDGVHGEEDVEGGDGDADEGLPANPFADLRVEDEFTGAAEDEGEVKEFDCV